MCSTHYTERTLHKLESSKVLKIIALFTNATTDTSGDVANELYLFIVGWKDKNNVCRNGLQAHTAQLSGYAVKLVYILELWLERFWFLLMTGCIGTNRYQHNYACMAVSIATVLEK